MVFDVIKNLDNPAPAEQIYLELSKKNFNISLSTIYRILDVFVEKGLVVKIIASDKMKAHFELNDMNHSHHITCMRCNSLVPVDNCPFHVYEKSLEDKTGFDITGHKLLIYGYCSQCKRKH